METIGVVVAAMDQLSKGAIWLAGERRRVRKIREGRRRKRIMEMRENPWVT